MSVNPTASVIKYVLSVLCIILAVFFIYYSFIRDEQVIDPLCPIPKVAGNKRFYSQYLEDFILSIFFKDIKKGTYIDVGANNPNKDSVTKYFYSMGWRGINIEPIHYRYLELVKYRPEDVNLDIGIAEKSEQRPFSVIFSKNNVELDVLSTFDRAFLNKARQDGYSSKSFFVNVKPLNEVLQVYPLKTIHFIKIDVEGMEDQVINSIDLSKHRPWVFIVEAVEPRTFIRSDGKWKDTLINNKYIYVMFDGLNAYYVAKERYQQLSENIKKAYSCALQVNSKYHVIHNNLQFEANPPHV